MKFDFRRVFTLILMLAFITAASYEFMCSADMVKCSSCIQDSHNDKSEATCKSCAQSENVVSVTNVKKLSIDLDKLKYDQSKVLEVSFTPLPVSLVTEVSPAISVHAFTKNIISITPIRGPTIIA